MSSHAQWPVVWGGMPPFADDPRRACRDKATDLFFGEGEGAKKATALAKAICGRCPLREQCATWSIPQASLRGVWGGLTEPDRERHREHHRAGTTPPPPKAPAPKKQPPPRKIPPPPTAAETERRLAAGRAAAAARTAQRMAKVANLAATGMEISDMAALTGYSRRTVHRYLKMLREQAHPNDGVAA